MRVLVTGCSGYIGPHLVDALRGRGDYVIGLDRVPPGATEPHVFIHGDLLDDGTVEKALTHDVDCIAHLAASRVDWGLTDDEYMRDNLWATKSLIEAGRKAEIRKWLFYSTVGVFGPSAVPLDDSAPPAPVGAYALSKARAEALLAKAAGSDPHMAIAVIRPSAVYGPGNPANTNVYRLIDAIHRRRFVMIGAGRNRKTTSYLPNLIAATLFLMERMEPGMSEYTYVDSPVLTTRELVDLLHTALGKRTPRWHLPLAVARPLALPSDLLARLTGVDLPITSARIDKFCRSTHFERHRLDEAGFLAPHSTEAALQATVDWYLDTHA